MDAAPARGPSLDTLPTPLYSDALLARAPQARLGVLQARGCYWGKCDYCDFVEVNLIPDLPSTTRQEALEGLADLESVADCMTEANVIPFEPTRSSRVGRAPSQFGLIAADGPGHSGHAQLALNTLAATDPAMTVAERAEVFRAYRAFAADVNARGPALVQEPSLNQYTVFVDGPGGPGLFNVATLEYLSVGYGSGLKAHGSSLPEP